MKQALRENEICGSLWIHMLRMPKDLPHLLPWRMSMLRPADPLASGRPWLTLQANAWLSRALREGTRVFEWGAGGSTIYFSKKGANVTSIEHDASWVSAVKARLESLGMTRADLRLVVPTPSTSVAPLWRSTDPRYGDASFEAYARTIESEPDQSIDLALVDGRARVGCVACALAKVRPGGYLILDNAERAAYSPALDLLGRWRRSRFAGLVAQTRTLSETSVWQRP